ncbi:MAG: cation:proton antiporter [Bdellovibrionales bacterium]
MDTSDLPELSHHASIYMQILVLLGASTFVIMVLQRLRLSPILGYMLAGLLIGPGMLGLIEDVEPLRPVAELGIACLLFIIGLELSLARMKALRQIIFGFSTLQVALSTTALGAILWAMGMPAFVAFLVGAALALSSTAVVLQLLAERSELSSRLGRTAFATLLLQDLVAIPLIAMAALGEPPDSPLVLVAAAAKATLALAIILVFTRVAGRPLLRRVARSRNMELFTAFTLFVVIGMGVVTDAVGLSMALGAFLAGLLLSGTEYRHKIEADIGPFKGLLLGLFFMTVGMSVNITTLKEEWLLIIAGIIGLTVIKALVIYGAARLTDKPNILAVRLAFYLAGAGEFAFVVIAALHVIGLLETDLAQQLLAITGGSLLLTPVFNELDRWVQRRYLPTAARALKMLTEKSEETPPAILLAGYGRMGEVIAGELYAQGVAFTGVDSDADHVATAQARGLPVYFGRADDMAMLRQMGVEQMQAVIIALDRRQAITDMVQILREEWPQVAILARAHDYDHAAELQALGVNVTVVETVAASLSLVEAALVLAEANAEIRAITGGPQPAQP